MTSTLNGKMGFYNFWKILMTIYLYFVVKLDVTLAFWQINPIKSA